MLLVHKILGLDLPIQPQAACKTSHPLKGKDLPLKSDIMEGECSMCTHPLGAGKHQVLMRKDIGHTCPVFC